MGLPGVSSACPAGHHPGLHGSTDYCCDRQQEGAQAEGKKPYGENVESVPSNGCNC